MVLERPAATNDSGAADRVEFVLSGAAIPHITPGRRAGAPSLALLAAVIA
jgi:hypothetical protein